MINWNILPTTEDPVTGNQWVDLEFLRALRQDLDELKSLNLNSRLEELNSKVQLLVERPDPPADGFDMQIGFWNESSLYGYLAEDLPVEGGKKYTLRGYLYHRIVPDYLVIKVQDDSGVVATRNLTTGNTIYLGLWRTFNTTFTASANATHVDVRFEVELPNPVTGYYMFSRDVHLELQESGSSGGTGGSVGGVVGGVGSELEGGGRPDEPQDP